MTYKYNKEEHCAVLIEVLCSECNRSFFIRREDSSIETLSSFRSTNTINGSCPFCGSDLTNDDDDYEPRNMEIIRYVDIKLPKLSYGKDKRKKKKKRKKICKK